MKLDYFPHLTNPFSELTVFAPTDAAFTAALAAMNISAADLLASPDLTDILLYHVLGAEVLSTSLSNGMLAEPLNVTNTLKITISGTDVFVNQAQVTAANVQAEMEQCMFLDGVVLPGETVADIAIDSPDHTTLVAAVVEARLLPALTNPFAELTVFAPTDAAFTAALSAMNISAADLLASPDLTDILLYHVLGAEVLSTGLSNGMIAEPLNALPIHAESYYRWCRRVCKSSPSNGCKCASGQRSGACPRRSSAAWRDSSRHCNRQSRSYNTGGSGS